MTTRQKLDDLYRKKGQLVTEMEEMQSELQEQLIEINNQIAIVLGKSNRKPRRRRYADTKTEEKPDS